MPMLDSGRFRYPKNPLSSPPLLCHLDGTATTVCFGISSSPEHFQKRMSRILEGLEGVPCQMDDVLIWGATEGEHDESLRKTLTRLQEAVVTNVSRIKFLGSH